MVLSFGTAANTYGQRLFVRQLAYKRGNSSWYLGHDDDLIPGDLQLLDRVPQNDLGQTIGIDLAVPSVLTCPRSTVMS